MVHQRVSQQCNSLTSRWPYRGKRQNGFLSRCGNRRGGAGRAAAEVDCCHHWKPAPAAADRPLTHSCLSRCRKPARKACETNKCWPWGVFHFPVCIYTTVPLHFDTTAPVMWLLGQGFLTGCSSLTSSISTHPVRRKGEAQKRSWTNWNPQIICYQWSTTESCLQTWLLDEKSFVIQTAQSCFIISCGFPACSMICKWRLQNLHIIFLKVDTTFSVVVVSISTSAALKKRCTPASLQLQRPCSGRGGVLTQLRKSAALTLLRMAPMMLGPWQCSKLSWLTGWWRIMFFTISRKAAMLFLSSLLSNRKNGKI